MRVVVKGESVASFAKKCNINSQTIKTGLLSEEDIARWWMCIAELLTMEHKRQIIYDFHRNGAEGGFKQSPAMANKTKVDWE